MVIRVAYGDYLGGAGAIWHSEAAVGPLAHYPGLRVVVPRHRAPTRRACCARRIYSRRPGRLPGVQVAVRERTRPARPIPAPTTGCRFGLARTHPGRRRPDHRHLRQPAAARHVAAAAPRRGARPSPARSSTCARWTRATTATTILESLKKTGRILVADEDRPVGGFGASRGRRHRLAAGATCSRRPSAASRRSSPASPTARPARRRSCPRPTGSSTRPSASWASSAHQRPAARPAGRFPEGAGPCRAWEIPYGAPPRLVRAVGAAQCGGLRRPTCRTSTNLTAHAAQPGSLGPTSQPSPNAVGLAQRGGLRRPAWPSPGAPARQSRAPSWPQYPHARDLIDVGPCDLPTTYDRWRGGEGPLINHRA